MADAQGLTQMDPGYDPSTDPSSPSFTGGGSGKPPTWFDTNAPPKYDPTKQYDPNDPTTWVNGQPPPGHNADGTTATPTPTPTPAKTFTNVEDAFIDFVNSDPSFKGGGQAAIDAFAKKYPQFTGVVSWDPARSVYGLPSGYLTNLPGGTGGWSLTPRGPESSGLDSQTLGGLTAPFTEGAPTPRVTPGFSYPSFNAPSGQDVLNGDPGYGFRLGQGEQALQGSAAARGVLNTGGTLKDILNYGQNAASQEYSDAFNRALGIYNTNYTTGLGAHNALFNENTTANNYDFNKFQNDQTVFWGNQNNAFSKLAQQQGVGLTAAQAT